LNSSIVKYAPQKQGLDLAVVKTHFRKDAGFH
jgi:hypothetical protein